MNNWHGKRWWIVGASEGLGRAVAEVMSRAGCELILSARNADRLEQLVQTLPGRASSYPLDVSDRQAVEQAALAIGPLDGMVYLAGVYWPMSAMAWDGEKADAMANINFMGAQRSVGAVVGPMLAQGYGHIVLTGSLSGFRGLPGTIGYGASKAAVMYLAESLQADLRRTPVRVQVINPGFIRTRLTEKNDFSMPFIMEPEDAAREFFEHMNTDGFKKSFPLVFSWLFRTSQFMPDWLYYRLFGGK